MPLLTSAAVHDVAKKGQPNPIDIHVGQRVRLRRKMLGVAQQKLGDNLGVTLSN